MRDGHLATLPPGDDDRGLAAEVRAGRLPEGKAEVGVAFPVLMESVSEYVSQVRIKPIVFLDRLSQSYKCPNLLTELFFQFYLLVRSGMRMDYCHHPTCRTPIPLSRNNRQFCDGTCRSGARYHSRNAHGAG